MKENSSFYRNQFCQINHFVEINFEKLALALRKIKFLSIIF